MRVFPALLLPLSLALLLAGCSDSAVYNPSVADLNAKAQALMAQGRPEAAIARLESARDLNPTEPNTLYNLAIAYLAVNKPDQAIPILEPLSKRGEPDRKAVTQSLVVAYETLADYHLGQLGDLSEGAKQNTPEAAQHRQEALAHYQKAAETLEAAIRAEGKSPEWETHLAQIQGEIQRLQKQAPTL